MAVITGEQWKNWSVADHINHIGEGIGARSEQMHVLAVQSKNALLMAEAGHAQAQQVEALVAATEQLAAASDASGRYARGLFWATVTLVLATLALAVVAALQTWLLWAARSAG